MNEMVDSVDATCGTDIVLGGRIEYPKTSTTMTAETQEDLGCVTAS